MTVAPAGEVAGSGSEGIVVTDVDPDGLASDMVSRVATSSLRSVAPRSPPRRICAKPRRRPKEWQACRAYAGEIRQYDEVRRHSFRSRLTEGRTPLCTLRARGRLASAKLAVPERLTTAPSTSRRWRVFPPGSRIFETRHQQCPIYLWRVRSSDGDQ